MYKNNNNAFSELLANGKKTEVLIAEFLTSKGYHITDTSDLKEYQDLDIDMLLEDKNGINHGLEIKRDTRIHSTSNVFVERGMYRKTGFKAGWHTRCQATVLGYYDEYSHICYMLKWASVQAIASKFRCVKFFNTSDDCWGEGYLVPLEYLKTNNLIYHTFDLSDYIENKEKESKEVA